MSGLSPSRRLRARTSDFFRGSSSSNSQVPSTSTSTPHLPQTGESSSITKSKRRLLFLGRSRKKSSQSEVLPSSSSTADLTTLGDGGQAPPLPPPPVATSPPPPSALPYLNVSPVSLGSKLAAAFTPSKPRPPNLHLPTPKHVKPKQSDPDSLDTQPQRPRSTSFQTSSSDTSGNVDPSPSRPAPIITVSVSPPQDLEDESFDDLFTRPNPTPRVDDKLDMSGSVPSPPSSPGMQFPNPPFESGHCFSGEGPSDFDVRGRDLEVLGSELDESADVSDDNTKKIVDLTGEDGKQPYSPSDNIEFGPSPWALSPNRRTLATMPYKLSEQTSYSPKSIMKPSSAGRTGPITAPPSIPLPSPPASVSSLPTMATLQTLPSRKLFGSTQQQARRPRAHTITSVFPPNLPIAPQSPPSPPNAAKKSRPKVHHKLPDANLDLDLDNATPDQLRAALATQRTLYDDFFVTISEKHATEKLTLQKRVEMLERDARKANREIKGLRYLVMNGTGAETTGSLPDLLGTSADVPRSALPSKSVQIDRPSGLSVPTSAKPTVGLGLDFTPDILLGGLHGFEHRLSVSSFASSADSSTSSLSSSDLATVLPVIPEASPSSPVPEPETPHDPVTAAILGIEKQKEKEERRASRALHRLSSSSTASSVSPPTVATTTPYPTNVKRGRPPSIAQVLDDSQNMEDVLEKLRPFSLSPAPFNP